MRSKRARLKRLQKHTEENKEIRIDFTCPGITPEPVYSPGDRVIHWTLDDKLVVEIIGADGLSHHHHHRSK